jgi:Amt family ammonium transporter
VKYWMRIDDSMDIFAEHGVAGIVGLIFNALFTSDAIIGMDGVNTGVGSDAAGWIFHNYKQLYIQVAYIVACTAYTFVMSALIAFAVNLIPGLHLRASEEAELLGMDDDQMGEFAYDYVEVRRDYLAWTPHHQSQKEQGHTVPAAQIYGISEHSQLASPNEIPASKESAASESNENVNGKQTEQG